VREQLRRDVDQIKIMASGGAMSPADELDTTQFTIGEMRAAAEEARAVGKYVLAHAYSDTAVRNAIEAGVRSIEHGNLIREAAAKAIKDAGAFLVPTMITYEMIYREGKRYGIGDHQIQKINLAREQSVQGLTYAYRAGCQIGSGSDLLGDMMVQRAVEFELKAQVMKLIVECSGAGPNDTVLDVACGPGLVVAAFARVVRHATGIDITPATLDRARAHAAAQGLANVTWHQGDVLPLPWPDASFSIVTSRFAFHHFLDPLAVLREMTRVAAPGGRVVVIDSTPTRERADAFNRMERLRDPSHVRSLPVDEHRELYARVGLPEPRVTSYRLEGELEALIGRSF